MGTSSGSFLAGTIESSAEYRYQNPNQIDCSYLAPLDQPLASLVPQPVLE